MNWLERNKKDEKMNLSYQNQITEMAKCLEESDAMVIGIGAGMTASGGISYTNLEVAQRWFPEYVSMGFKGLIEIQSVFCNLTEENVLAYWGYWARHIQFIRYILEVLSTYEKLAQIMKDKNYFICTTNADGQTQKAGFKEERIFAPKGNYDAFQCSIPCRKDEIYPNQDMIEKMIESINTQYEILEAVIPRCPHCGHYLIPNLRCDDRFV